MGGGWCVHVCGISVCMYACMYCKKAHACMLDLCQCLTVCMCVNVCVLGGSVRLVQSV